MTNQYDHIKSIAEEYRPSPPPMAWDKIEHRLSEVDPKSKGDKLKALKYWFSIAASVMVIITCTYIIYQESISPQTYGVDYVAEWEDLNIKKDYFYSVENARLINNVNKN